MIRLAEFQEGLTLPDHTVVLLQKLVQNVAPIPPRMHNHHAQYPPHVYMYAVLVSM